MHDMVTLLRFLPHGCVVSVLLLSPLTASPANAACKKARAVLSATAAANSFLFTPGHPFTPESDYPRTTRGGSTSYYVTGSFWSFGGGDPAVGKGNDNGRLVGGYAPQRETMWLFPGYHENRDAFIGGPYGHWRSPEIDGCVNKDGSDPSGPDADECVMVMVSDQGKDDATFFALLSTGPDGIGDFQFTERTGFPARIELAKVPVPQVRASRAAGPGRMAVELTWDAGELEPKNGFFLQCRRDEALEGYRVYSRTVAQGESPPKQFNSQAIRRRWGPELTPWSPLSPSAVTPGESTTVELPCRPGETVTFCATMTFGGSADGARSYELPFCSAGSPPVACVTKE